MFKLYRKWFVRYDLVRSFNRREEKGFIQIFDSCYYCLFHFASRLLNEKKGVDGVIEKTFSIIWNSKKEWKSIPELKRDLFRTTQTLCTAQLMKLDKWDKRISNRSFFHEYVRSQVFKNIKDTLDSIPEEYHGLFILRFVFRKDLDVIENIYGIPKEKSVEVQSKIQSIFHNKFQCKKY